MNLFWGCALILAGLSIIVNILFGINLPIIKIFLAGFLIYLGLKMLLPSRYGCSTYFSSSCQTYESVTVSDDKEKYAVSFSSTVIDLTHLTVQNTPPVITVDAQFAHVVVLLPKNLPIRVKANMRFANVSLPGHKMSAEYVNLHGAATPVLTIYINSQFASVVVKE